MLQVVDLLHRLPRAMKVSFGKPTTSFDLQLKNAYNSHRDFRLPRVKSINASGHKYGQALLAVGWIVWREKKWIPEGLLLESSYLRGTQTAYTLSFSKSSAPIVSQYYQFYQKGLAGYRRLINRYLDIAKLLSLELENTGYFVCLSGSTGRSICREGNHNMNPGIPLVVFTLSEGAKKDYPTLDMSALSDAVHEMKFSIPRKFSEFTKPDIFTKQTKKLFYRLHH